MYFIDRLLSLETSGRRDRQYFLLKDKKKIYEKLLNIVTINYNLFHSIKYKFIKNIYLFDNGIYLLKLKSFVF